MSQLQEHEAMSPVNGWIVGWLHGDDRHTQLEQSPALRVFVGSLIHVRHEAPSVRALVQVDGYPPRRELGHHYWIEVKLQPFEAA